MSVPQAESGKQIPVNLAAIPATPEIPLYERDLQISTPEIARTIYDQAFHGEGEVTRFHLRHIVPDYAPRSWEFFSMFVAENQMYVDPDHARGLHGPPHEGRVGLNFLVIAQREQLSEEDTITGLLGSLAHDLARKNDMADLGHGERSAKHFVTEVLPQIQKGFTERGIAVTNRMIDAAVALCIYHEVDYEKIPPEVLKNSHRDYDKLFRCFTDADKLDRYRDLDPSKKHWTKREFLKTDTGRLLFDTKFSQYLTLSSEKERLEKGQTPAEMLKEKGLELGVLHNGSIDTYTKGGGIIFP